MRQEVTDYGASWTVVAKKLAPSAEFHNFVDIFGVDAAQRIFRRHVKKLKDNYLSEKVARYLDLLPEVNNSWTMLVEKPLVVWMLYYLMEHLYVLPPPSFDSVFY